MKKIKNLEQISQSISDELIGSIYLMKIMQDLLQENGKMSVLIETILNKTKSAFYKTEKFRKLISNV